MALDSLVLRLVIALAVLWLAALLAGLVSAGPAGLLGAVPLAVIGFLLWRVVAERRANPEDDRYDWIEK